MNVPALRHRKEEIGILLRYSMRKLSKYYGSPGERFHSVDTGCLSESLVAWKSEGIGNLRQALSDRGRRRNATESHWNQVSQLIAASPKDSPHGNSK